MRRPKKGQAGAAVGFMTRGQALRKLQVSLSLFRKLCILKGVYPREPSKKVRGKDKTYYYSKDILFLAHDPILSKFREEKTWRKRMAKAKGRKENPQTIKRITNQRPTYKFDNIVRERYPTFIDALRDLDDALCILFFFATLPNSPHVPPAKTAKSRRLCLEFQSYVLQSRSLRKVFVSIKGIYYQAEIMGQIITWIVPFQFNINIPKEVDFRIMMSFSDFYETLLGFVNFKLYHTLGLHYPPLLDPSRESNGESLFSVVVSSLNKPAISNGDNEDEEQDDEQIQGEEEKKIFQQNLSDDKEVQKLQNIFSGLYFYLSREVPKYSLEFVIRSFGGEVSWDSPSAPYNESFEKITHHVVDRPSIQTLPYRSYIQPQWVYDSINAGILLPTDDYALDATLPPHLSPFVDYEKEGYMPKRAEEIKAIVEASKGNYNQSVSTERFDGEEEVEESDEEARYEQELRAEKEGTSPAALTPSKKLVKEKLEELERKKFAEIMIPNKKKRRLYQKIQFAKQRKLRQNQNLLDKRKLLSEGKK